MNLREFVKLISPPVLLNAIKYILNFRKSENNEIEGRRDSMHQCRENVDVFIKEISNLSNDMLSDEKFMERFIIEKIGLNNETLSEQPSELKESFGKGLYIWQYPKQFAKYIVWLMENANTCNSYVEIGCRWGGTFIVICEVLKRANPNFKFAIAADIIETSPFILRYIEINKQNDFEIFYFNGSSLSDEFISLVKNKKPEIAFIDGDHSFAVALQDHMNVREFAKIIIHHDINSDACPEIVKLWEILKKLEVNRKCVEFSDQYESVDGNYLGIGVLFEL